MPDARRRALDLLRPEWPALLWAFACMAVLTASTAFAAWLVGPVLHALVLGGRPDGMLAGLLPVEALRNSPWLLPVLLLAVGAIKGAAYFGQFRLMGMAGQRVGSRLRQDLLAALVHAGPAYLARSSTGDLLSRFSSDVGAVEQAVTYAIAAYVRDSLTAAALFGLCVALDWRLSLLAFGLVPLTALPIVRVARRILHSARRAQAGQG